uniref:5'-Nucleotidase C-terminal domain-containing protein n=1 Tax=Chromera velia CCMP2878 TaxID=1169474 RepID=A0A0G4FXX2_9ALVE|eukprot:Cvel_3894.t1-p1 / transcript=Cvel_3894.t1 / gene=Cvel_3894 / organism=Chromera_velia_CCMP2878 / gene_product=Trifunctional nucleotide phosphoesterase protein, putative / transcript_product=Trifunctional nucleotide phosphoesterase protein, putative / location=Cvel_scaffold165:13782-17813(+) / protein_length=655 / sequence_SO=supercontig / SO=protein_coding / is_pseudo=false
MGGGGSVHSGKDGEARGSSDVKPEKYTGTWNCASNTRTGASDPRPPDKTPLVRRDSTKEYTGEKYLDFVHPFGRDDPITIIHFNDVYNVDPPKNGWGGAPRFVGALRSFAKRNPLILFSGDAFNPSMMSTHTKGKHMVAFLNMMKIHTACYGNHDFDFGVDNLEYLAGSCGFPWLISNVTEKESGLPLANGQVYRLFEWQGHRIGVIGLVEREWLATLAHVSEEDVVFEDFVVSGSKLAKQLRAKGAELIIALTHMRAPNDEKLAREQEGIDLILGGHDHQWYGHMRMGSCVVGKSGTDFREFSLITIHPGKRTQEAPGDENDKNPPMGSFRPSNETKEGRTEGRCLLERFQGGSLLEWRAVEVQPELFPSVPAVERIVDDHLADLAKSMDEVVGYSAVTLETRFGKIRTEETNVGNWLTDLMRASTKSDIALLNGGTVRSDSQIRPGPLKLRDITAMLPMMDPLCVVRINGEQMVRALENSVSQYPKLEGRFAQVSGIRFVFDGSAPAGNRIVRECVEVFNDKTGEYEPLEDDKSYRLCLKDYLRDGKDGYTVFPECELLMDSEVAGYLPTMVRNALQMADLASGVTKPVSVLSQHNLQRMLSCSEDQLRHVAGLAQEKDSQSYKINVRTEGRITVVNGHDWDATPSGSPTSKS